jgi:UDP-N-acetylglucosamine 2-epimerase (non-hydrolysing)
MLKVLTVFGTRPEAIKLAPVIKELEKYPDEIKSVVCVTGQHREMLDQVLEIFGITPDIDLDLMEEDQTLEELTAKAFPEITKVIKNVYPDILLVQGDTTTAMLTALAAFYQKIKVGHVEAGLRTNDIYNPFPEEVNRRLISVVSSYNFAPTETAYKALANEGFKKDSIYITGNTVIDALLMTVKKKHKLNLDIPVDNRRIILVTAHRRESFGIPFENICNALKDIATQNENIEIIYPVHLNPNVQEPVDTILSDIKRVHLIEPLEYLDFVQLMNKSYLILTDSGGIQEEAPALGKPVLVMREKTERPEAVKVGIVKLVGTDTKKIVKETENLLKNKRMYERMSKAHNPYGDGKAAERIVKILLEQKIT